MFYKFIRTFEVKRLGELCYSGMEAQCVRHSHPSLEFVRSLQFLSLISSRELVVFCYCKCIVLEKIQSHQEWRIIACSALSQKHFLNESDPYNISALVVSCLNLASSVVNVVIKVPLIAEDFRSKSLFGRLDPSKWPSILLLFSLAEVLHPTPIKWTHRRLFTYHPLLCSRCWSTAELVCLWR